MLTKCRPKAVHWLRSSFNTVQESWECTDMCSYLSVTVLTESGLCHGNDWQLQSFCTASCRYDLVEQHYRDAITSAMASEITGVSIVCSAVCSDVDQRKHQSSASLAFVRGIHRWIPLVSTSLRCENIRNVVSPLVRKCGGFNLTTCPEISQWINHHSHMHKRVHTLL